MITQLSPGRRARLARLGIHPSRIGRVINTAVLEPKDIPTPKNQAEFRELLADSKYAPSVLANADTLVEVIEAYRKETQAPETDLNKLVAEETQRQLAAYLKDNEVSKDERDQIKRLNLDPQTRPTGMLTSHKQATAYNSQAAGAVLDKEFTSAAEYFRTAWHLNTNADDRAKMERIHNAYSSVVPSEGGFLVPETLRSALLALALEKSVVRPRATVVPMETATVPFPMIDSTTNAGSVFGGMIGYWAEESAAFQESNPKFGRIKLEAQTLTGFALVPNQLLADSLISFAALIERLWPQALAFFEDLAFMGGDGVGKPKGFLGAGNTAAIVVDAEAGQESGTIVLENILNMYARLLPASMNSAVWVVSQECIPQLYTLALSVGTGGTPVMLVNAAGPGPATMLGLPIVVSEKAGRLGTRGDIALADLGYYLIGDRQVMSADSSTDYRFANNQTAYRILQRVDGRPWLKSPITPANNGDTLSPFIELAARP